MKDFLFGRQKSFFASGENPIKTGVGNDGTETDVGDKVNHGYGHDSDSNDDGDGGNDVTGFEKSLPGTKWMDQDFDFSGGQREAR